MSPDQLSHQLLGVLEGLVDEGALTLSDGLPTRVKVERPRIREHGDYATNVALQLAKQAGAPPRALAGLLATRLAGVASVDSVEVAGPGFLNIRVAASAQGLVAATVVAAGESYGASGLLAGERVNVEFVSANPTGPVHLGGARWAVVGDALGRILATAGAEVTREYYFNDHGAQIDRFVSSLLAAARDEPTPVDGYGGAYVGDIARTVLAARHDVLALPEDQCREVFRSVGVSLMFDEIKRSLRDLGVHFDVWFHEHDLHASGAVDKAVGRLREMGNVYEHEGALWVRTEQYGDDKDRVIVRSDGTGAYLSGDAAYYVDKKERGFDRCVVMLGADHHGYVPRLMALCRAFGDVPGRDLEVLVGQLVSLVRDGEPVRMSKRAGTVVTLEDLVAAIGVDAARYALTRYTSGAPLTVDLDLWARASSDNPVYYVQYAHARLASVLRNAADLGITASADDVALLTHEREGDLLRALAELPRVVATAAELREPHRVARYLEETAAAFHRFYDACRVLPMGDDQPAPLHRARLLLVDATRVVLANGLALLGVSAPARM